MGLPAFTDYRAGDMPSASSLNRLQRAAESHDHFYAGDGLNFDQGAGGVSISAQAPDRFFVVLTAVDTTHTPAHYGYSEVQSQVDGTWAVALSGRSAPATDPFLYAQDLNGAANLATDSKTVVELVPSNAGYFYYIKTSTSGTAAASAGFALLGQVMSSGGATSLYEGTLLGVTLNFFGLPAFVSIGSCWLWDFQLLNPQLAPTPGLTGSYYGVVPTGLFATYTSPSDSKQYKRQVYGIIGGWAFSGACQPSLAQILLNTY